MSYRVLLGLVVLASSAPLTRAEKPDLPKVVLLGDSIRLGYAPLVARRLEGKAILISPEGAGDTTWLLKQLDAVIAEKPSVIHFNAGLHDLRSNPKTDKHQVELDE